MLVLKRKPEQAVQIGPDITIEVLEVAVGYVRLGVSAPRDVRVLRDELLPARPDHGTPAAETPART